MWLISLLFLPLSAATSPTPVPTFSPTNSAIPYGIQYNSVTVSDLMARGCSVCYKDTYAGNTNSNDISSCAGPVLFAGAQNDNWSSSIYLGAFGLASEVQRSTERNTPHLSNGVYWYFTSGKSFGFLGDDTLEQATADIGTTNPGSRLSWNLSKYGGYRLGLQIPSGWPAGTYRKRIYSGPLMII